jgi:hypothetical protein
MKAIRIRSGDKTNIENEEAESSPLRDKAL